MPTAIISRGYRGDPVKGRPVARMALLAYVLAAGAGLVLLTVLVRGGAHRPRTRSKLAPVPAFAHLTLAVIGLLMLLAYLSAPARMLAWMVLLALVPVVAIGLTMVLRWLRVRRQRGNVESRMPVGVVVGHGVLGVATVVLVLLTALRA